MNAGELIAETVHALEMGSDAEDIALTIHPHPTLTETIGFAAEMAEGTITDLMPPRGSAPPPRARSDRATDTRLPPEIVRPSSAPQAISAQSGPPRPAAA